ncbi:uncharacterized protein LOC144910319 isoform X1 [Branchiostoma floridae x Branchiostoma belcheri]
MPGGLLATKSHTMAHGTLSVSISATGTLPLEIGTKWGNPEMTTLDQRQLTGEAPSCLAADQVLFHQLCAEVVILMMGCRNRCTHDDLHIAAMSSQMASSYRHGGLQAEMWGKWRCQKRPGHHHTDKIRIYLNFGGLKHNVNIPARGPAM